MSPPDPSIALAADLPAHDAEPVLPSGGLVHWRRLQANKLALASLAFIVFMLLVSLLAPWISPYDPNAAADPSLRLAPPGTPGHLLGLDGQGRDLLSRLIWGGRQ